MSALPAGVYTAHAMATSGKTAVTADTGDQHGEYRRARVPIFNSNTRTVVTTAHLGDNVLPSGSPSEFTMATSLKTLILGETDGQRSPRRKLVLYIVPVEAAACLVEIDAFVDAAALLNRFTCLIDIQELAQGYFEIADRLEIDATVAGQVGVHGSFTGAAADKLEIDCTVNSTAQDTPHFSDKLEIRTEVFVRDGQLAECVTGDNLVVAGGVKNYVY